MIKNDSKAPSNLNYKTDYCLLTVNFSIDDIAKILQNLDPNKAYGDDKISIRMLQLCGKIFERLIFNEMFKFFIENELVSPNQSGCKPRGSCTNELLAITHEIYKSFDEGFEVRGVFLDISKTFDKVWHEGLILN